MQAAFPKMAYLCEYVCLYFYFRIRINPPNFQKMEIQQTLISKSALKHQPDMSESKINPETVGKKDSTQSHKSQITLQPQQQTDIKCTQDIAVSQIIHKSIKQHHEVPNDKLTKSKHSHSYSYTDKLSMRFNHKNIDKINEVGQNPLQDYQQLTSKLESALEKINSKKTINRTSGQGQDTLHRFKQLEEKKKKNITNKKQLTQQTHAKQLKEKPTINYNSQKIAKELGHKPIHLRVQKMVQDKKRKLEEYQQLKKKQQEEEQLQYIQQYNKHVKKPESKRSYDAYFSEMVRWKEKSEHQNRQKFEFKKSNELQGITFTPSLNAKSLKMVSSHQRLPIYQRGLVKKKEVQPHKLLLKTVVSQ